MTMIIPWNANTARPIAEKFLPAKIGSARNCRNVMPVTSQLISREKSQCVVIPNEARNLTIRVAITLRSLCDATPSERSFAPLRMTTRNISQPILRGKSPWSISDVKLYRNLPHNVREPKAASSQPSRIFEARWAAWAGGAWSFSVRTWKRHSRLSFYRSFELDRFAFERVDDSRRNGSYRSVAEQRRESFRFVLCSVFRAGVCRHRIGAARAVCTPHA